MITSLSSKYTLQSQSTNKTIRIVDGSMATVLGEADRVPATVGGTAHALNF